MGERRFDISASSEPEPAKEPERTVPGDCLEWARHFLPEHFRDEPASFHRELMRDLASGRRLIARVAPRGHAKSTCAALAYPLWRVCERLSRNIVIITHERSLATQFVRDIRHELETNDLIIAAYGDLTRSDATAGARRLPRARTRFQAEAAVAAPSVHDHGPLRRQPRRKWSEALFTASNGVTVQARGSAASLRGCRVGSHRPDLIICDDIEEDAQVRSAEGRKKLERWMRRVVMPALAPDGQLVVIGSLLHYDSLLANLARPHRWRQWDYRMYRAIEAELREDGELYSVALWPARWPLWKLDEERERVGTIAFEQEYMANPIDDETRTFKPEWLQTYDPAVLEGQAGDLVNLIAVDPAAGRSSGDYFALWVGSLNLRTGVIYSRELTLERLNIVEQVERIISAYLKWKPERVGIETVGYQKALKDALDDESRRRRLYIPTREFNTRTNKVARVQGAAPFFENGTFLLPPKLSPEAEAQFLNFPKTGHDDGPDVCAIGLELARGFWRASQVEAMTSERGIFENRGAW
jgi:predicted phage terminase large subunit-like protein